MSKSDDGETIVNRYGSLDGLVEGSMSKAKQTRIALKYYDLIPILIVGLKRIQGGEGDPKKIAAETLLDWDKARGKEDE